MTVTNRLYLPGKFTVTKAVTGAGASLVPGSTSFTVEYSTDGGTDWTPVAVTPSTPVPAVTLSYGTSVLIREATPPAIAGVPGAAGDGEAGVTTVPATGEAS